MAQEVGQETTPLVQTRIEKVRMVRIQPQLYNLLRSFTESSIREGYEWRTALELPDAFIWRKGNRWELKVYKKVKLCGGERLPVRGIYRIVDKEVQPAAILRSLKTGAEAWFVLVKANITGELEMGIYYDAAVRLAFTRWAPIAITPMLFVPFARPIPVYEIVDTLSYYVSF
jgi:hypothetical protein